MSEERVIRINKVLRELNISLDRAVDFLKEKGHEIESSPNAKISQEEYKVLCGQFSADKGNKVASLEVSEEKRKEKEALKRELEKEQESKRLQEEERQRIAALLSIFGVVIVFWAVFKQNASALTTFAETYTDREIPVSVQPIAKPFGMIQTVSTDSAEYPMYDQNFKLVYDEAGNKQMTKSPHPYFQNLPKDQWPTEAQDSKLQLYSTEIFQSINPFFIVLITPLILSFFAFLRMRGKEPSTPAKIAYGLLITGSSTLVMVGAVYSTNLSQDKASALWLIGCYAVVTVGELFLSPIGLSLVSKVAPERLTALMMGGWFLATSIGNKLSGVLSSMWDNYENKANFFYVNFFACMLAGLAIFAMLKWLRGIISKH